MNFRSPEFRRLCYEFDCLLQIPGVCEGGTGEPCHANWSVHGKGGAMKAHDCFVVPGCRACHRELDQGNRLSRETKRAVWTNAFWRFLPALFERGLIGVRGYGRCTCISDPSITCIAHPLMAGSERIGSMTTAASRQGKRAGRNKSSRCTTDRALPRRYGP